MGVFTPLGHQEYWLRPGGNGQLNRPGFCGGFDRTRDDSATGPPSNVRCGAEGRPCVACMLWLAAGRGPVDMTAVPRRRSISMRSLPHWVGQEGGQAHRTACAVTRGVTRRGCMVGLGEVSRSEGVGHAACQCVPDRGGLHPGAEARDDPPADRDYVEIESENLRPVTWVIVEEVKSGGWASAETASPPQMSALCRARPRPRSRAKVCRR
jgi:hypothetical protein